MIRGLYIGASGMLVELRRTDVISNNLANAATNGYKRDELVGEGFPAMLLRRLNDVPGPTGLPAGYPPVVGRLGLGGTASETATDWATGPLTETGNPLDLAIAGDGLFAVRTPNGERYTRDGAFTRDAQGFLVTEGGLPVLGENGPIQLGAGAVEVAGDGTVSVDGEPAGRLRLVRFPAGARLLKEGDNLYVAAGAAGEPAGDSASVRQGYLERSNVNTVREMIGLISSFRSYEANQKVIQTQNELLQKTVTEVGRV